MEPATLQIPLVVAGLGASAADQLDLYRALRKAVLEALEGCA